MALEPHLARMRAYADAAREHPTWSVAYAEDVPMLLAEIDRLSSTDDRTHRLRKAETDLTIAYAEVARLRAWLEQIALNGGRDLPLYRIWAAQALEGEKPRA
jgi:hypothetical protein